MCFRKIFKNKTANSFLEYTILLGIVSLLIIGMNVYIKRGVQAKIKDMADNFISREQVGETDPKGRTDANSTVIADNRVVREALAGGGLRNTITDSTNTSSTRRTVTQAKGRPHDSFTPSERGNVTLPPAETRP